MGQQNTMWGLPSHSSGAKHTRLSVLSPSMMNQSPDLLEHAPSILEHTPDILESPWSQELPLSPVGTHASFGSVDASPPWSSDRFPWLIQLTQQETDAKGGWLTPTQRGIWHLRRSGLMGQIIWPLDEKRDNALLTKRGTCPLCAWCKLFAA